MTINGQSGGILPVLVFGAGTDYALLLVVALPRGAAPPRGQARGDAARAAHAPGPAIFASGLTVIAALLALSLAEVNGTAGLGPIGAMGVALAMISMLTVLPALLAISAAARSGARVLAGQRIPHVGDAGADETHGFWRRVGDRVAAAPRRGLGRHDARAARAGARACSTLDTGLTQRQLVPRRGRVGRGPGAARRSTSRPAPARRPT